MRNSIIAALLCLCAASAQAQNNNTTSLYEIGNLVFHSKNEPIYPSYAGVVIVTFTQPLAWIVPGVCSSSGVVIRDIDNHIVSAIQTALATGRSVQLYVDDSQKMDGLCFLRAVKY